MDFILMNFDAICGGLMASGLIIYGVATRQWMLLRVGAYKLMLSAEKLLNTAEGKQKMEDVFIVLWSNVPKWMKLFVKEQTLRDKLQKWYDIAKDELSE